MPPHEAPCSGSLTAAEPRDLAFETEGNGDSEDGRPLGGLMFGIDRALPHILHATSFVAPFWMTLPMMWATRSASAVVLAPPPASSNALTSAITGAAAVGGAFIAGGFTWLVSKQSRDVATRASAETQLREARQRGADDIRAVGHLGASLDATIASMLAEHGTAQMRDAVKSASSDVEAQLEFIWDEELRLQIGTFARLARESAEALDDQDLRTRGALANQAWERARARAGEIWRVRRVRQFLPPRFCLARVQQRPTCWVPRRTHHRALRVRTRSYPLPGLWVGMSLSDASKALLTQAQERDSFHVPLPRLRVPCSVVSGDGSVEESDDALDVAERFVYSPSASLLVILGEVGSGKSELLRRLAQRAHQTEHPVPLLIDYADMAKHLTNGTGSNAIKTRLEAFSATAAEEFNTLIDTDPARAMLLIDAFDEINVSLHVNDAPPQAQSLLPFISERLKTVVAARRSLAASPAAMTSVFSGIANDAYLIVELQPCELEDVDKALGSLPEAQAEIMRDYLLRGEHIQMSRVRRPLFLQMLMDLPSDMLRDKDSFSIYELYDLYADVTLDRDILRKASIIPRLSKRRILQNIAQDMFDLQVEPKRASSRTQSHSGSSRRSSDRTTPTGLAPNGAGYNWTTISTTPITWWSSGAARWQRSHGRYVFVHQSMFEFFLTQHFATSFQTTGRFGLEDGAHSVRAFDSLLPYFLRSQFGLGKDPNLEAELVRMVTHPNTSNIDRLLGFFFLEDSPQIRKLLRSAEDTYRLFLHDAASKFDSFFMEKVVRYQLTLLDVGIGRALAYVTDARVREIDTDQDIEVHTFAAGQDPTEFLLARLGNPHLWTARPITVYRLGLFGDERAVAPLERLATELGPGSDPCLQALVNEAIEEIVGRTAERSKRGWWKNAADRAAGRGRSPG